MTGSVPRRRERVVRDGLELKLAKRDGSNASLIPSSFAPHWGPWAHQNGLTSGEDGEGQEFALPEPSCP